jgi:DNA (cytosine-5)-methyltransferase 1
LGIEVKWHIENEERCYKYLRQQYPGSKIYRSDESIKGIEPVHIIAGGDPCQPHSSSGLGLGTEDDRYRWPYMFGGIKYLRPDWVINENVIGSISNLVLDQKITDLESIGYTCQPYVIPAVAVGACHYRRRIFLVAYAHESGRQKFLLPDVGGIYTARGAGKQYALGTQGNAFLQFEESMGEPALLAMDDGLPDNIFQLGAIGNSIAAPIPLILLESILWMYKNGYC